MEQKRAQSVIRFSGTLSHPSHTDKTGLTIVAFAHYAYCYSQKNIVFADIQGKLISPLFMNVFTVVEQALELSIMAPQARNLSFLML